MASKRRFSKRFSRGPREYIWVMTQVDEAAISGGASNNQDLVVGADWERGGADARETCSLVRSIVEFRFHAADVHLYPIMFAMGVFDEDEGIVAPNGLASNGDERWLGFGFIPHLTSFSDNTVGSGATGYRHFESKQRVRLGNNDELRLSVLNDSASVGVLYWMTARVLL